MSDELTSDEPIPAVPLNYFEQHREPWVPMVQMVGKLIIAFSIYQLICYLSTAACFVWQQLEPARRMQLITGISIGIEIPMEADLLMNLAGAMKAIGEKKRGRVPFILSKIRGFFPIISTFHHNLSDGTSRKIWAFFEILSCQRCFSDRK